MTCPTILLGTSITFYPSSIIWCTVLNSEFQTIPLWVPCQYVSMSHELELDQTSFKPSPFSAKINFLVAYRGAISLPKWLALIICLHSPPILHLNLILLEHSHCSRSFSAFLFSRIKTGPGLHNLLHQQPKSGFIARSTAYLVAWDPFFILSGKRYIMALTSSAVYVRWSYFFSAELHRLL